MFSKQRQKRNYLHQNLQKYNDGLSVAQLSDLLNISDKECEKLLAQEENRGNVDCTYNENWPIYFSRKKVDVSYNSTTNFWIKLILVIGVTLVSLALFVIFQFSNVFSQPYEKSVTFPDPLINNQTSKTVTQYQSKQSDLEKRIKLMESERVRCNQKWENNETCYVTNRLLTKTEFEQELNELKSQVN